MLNPNKKLIEINQPKIIAFNKKTKILIGLKKKKEQKKRDSRIYIYIYNYWDST